MKKQLTLLALSIPSLCFATIGHNFYVGLNASYLNGTAKSEAKDTSISAYANIDGGFKAPAIGIFIGYGYHFQNNLYLAAEGFYQFQNAKSEYDLGDTWIPGVRPRGKMSSHRSFGFRIIPGYYFTPKLMGYFQFGMINTPATVQLNANEKNTNDLGFQFGIGAEYNVTQNLSIRLGARESIYKKVNAQSLSGNTTGSFSPSVLEAEIGIKYTL